MLGQIVTQSLLSLRFTTTTTTTLSSVCVSIDCISAAKHTQAYYTTFHHSCMSHTKHVYADDHRRTWLREIIHKDKPPPLPCRPRHQAWTCSEAENYSHPIPVRATCGVPRQLDDDNRFRRCCHRYRVHP